MTSMRRAGSRDMLFKLQAAGPEWRTDAMDNAEAASSTDDTEDDQGKEAADYSDSRHAAEAEHLLSQLNLDGHSRPPRVLMVSRRHCRKNKYVDIVGEYHLDLVQDCKAAAIVIPRTVRTALHLAEYLPMDGLIIAEGNDLSDDILLKYGCAVPGRLEGDLAQKYASDTEFDVSKDELEFALMRFALTVGCPVLTFCRGCQMLNALRGGTLIGDIESEVQTDLLHLRQSGDPDYDSFRHPIRVAPNTPLAEWFAPSLRGTDELLVNSYHHQAVKDLGQNLREMARSPDGIIEGFYDADYDPEAGRFVVGLQFHPERMLSDYSGCAEVYKAFGKACHAYKTQQEHSHA
uniref:Glutamine amidotransferase domain-containing protein n=1 Tax=Alexandrium catenella TaxID=2925 RepID=A0A7S1WT67_ALECA